MKRFNGEFPEPSPSRLVIAAMWRPGEVPAAGTAVVPAAPGEDARSRTVRLLLERDLGPVSRCSGVYEFSAAYSGYYEPEMGAGLLKAFFEIRGVVSRGSLPDWKLRTIRAELAGRRAGDEAAGAIGGRTVNLDPMLVSLENVVIATSKIAPHRVYLGSSVFAELALLRKDGKFRPLPWTYRDYSDQAPFFEEVAIGLRGELRAGRVSSGPEG